MLTQNRCHTYPGKPASQSHEFIEGITLFNQGKFYQCHDALEEAWKQDRSLGRDLYRAILQIGIAYYQIKRGNYRGGLKMLLRVRQWLDPLYELVP